MKIQVSTWAEVVGIAALVLSLIFVGFEIQQNTNAVAAQAILSLNEFAHDTTSSVSQDEEFARLVSNGHKNDPLTELEEERYGYYVQHLLNVAEAAWTFHQRGLITNEEFQGWQATTCSWLALPGVNKFWKSDRVLFIEGFRSSAESWCDQTVVSSR